MKTTQFAGDRAQLESVLRERLVGRRVVHTQKDGTELVLDDGTFTAKVVGA